MNKNNDAVGIASVGMYLPENYLTAEDIARESGLPLDVVRNKLGIEKKYISGPDDHPNEMALKAARDCFAHTDIKPDEVDVVLCTTEEWREYLLWTSGIHLAYEIGARNAWAMDMHMRCCTSIAAVKIAKDLMNSDKDINTVLIAGGYAIDKFINFKNPKTTFLYNIGAGAGAMLLRRGMDRNHILGSQLFSDGSMSKDVIVPASGTIQHPTDKAVREGKFYFDLINPESMKQKLNESSMDIWVWCSEQALKKSGNKPDGTPYTKADLDFVNMVLVKPSAHYGLLDRLGLSHDKSVYTGNIGHIGEQDTIISIIEGIKQGKLKDGNLMLMLGAGIGYVWGATCVKWGPC